MGEMKAVWARPTQWMVTEGEARQRRLDRNERLSSHSTTHSAEGEEGAGGVTLMGRCLATTRRLRVVGGEEGGLVAWERRRLDGL